MSKENFSAIVAREDVQHHKPHPECYQSSLLKLKAKAEKTWVIEDTAAGMHSAKSAGCKVAIVKHSWNSSQNFQLADFVFEDFEELEAMLLKR